MKVKYQFSLTLIESRQWWCNLGVKEERLIFVFIAWRHVTWCMSLVTISHAKLQNKRYLTNTFNTELKAFNQKLFTNVPYYISLYFLLTNSIIISLSVFSAFVTSQDHTIWISSIFFLLYNNNKNAVHTQNKLGCCLFRFSLNIIIYLCLKLMVRLWN